MIILKSVGPDVVLKDILCFQAQWFVFHDLDEGHFAGSRLMFCLSSP